ncbi:hypothetical protein COU54_01925 [Candidatus Pacearchaeota archaeon CG10_big_fil_rev_8_21_14_0_10_31_24]|nr:MAG: hypothetical protein COU54_01925 [Candidatus Pacearchaeota archaeon CG10_big_fil_rev_8_21_14_0_10_31_24]
MKNNKIRGLSLQVIPFSEVKDLSISERVKKILSLILSKKIVILHGRLRSEEEARLIEDTMALVDHVKDFKGIELAVIEPNMKNTGVLTKMKHGIAKRLIGDSSCLTVIGPASIVKEIKRDPKKIELLFN